MDIAAIRAGLAAAVVNSISGMQTMPTVPDRIDPPTFSAGEVEIDYNQTSSVGGLTVLLCKGRLYSSRADVAAGQANLDGYLAPTGALSIKAAIEADKTLGGACRTLHVERAHGYGRYEVGGVDYYGIQLDVRVWAI